MPYKEFGGKTAKEAVRKACQELKITKDKLKYDVISYGSSGIFGLVGMKKAKIRVYVPPTLESTNLDKELGSDLWNDVKVKKNDFKDKSESDSESIIEKPKKELDESKPEELELNKEKIEPKENYDKAVLKGKQVLEKILDTISTDTSLTIDRSKDKLLYHIKGGNTSILIGKRGQTLEAMQFLIDKVVNRNRIKNKYRVRIDVEGYLKIREQNLTKLAAKLSDQVKKSGRAETLHPMNAHDRRIIHLALKNDSRVKTQSIGSGYYRKLVIFPNSKNR